MLGNLMIAVMALGVTGGPSCTNDFQSAKAVDVDPIEVSATRADSGMLSVGVLATIGADGRIVQVDAPGAPDHVARAVERASSGWVFEPAQACGEAVAQEVMFELPVLVTRFANIDTDHTPGPDRQVHRARPREGSRGALGVHSSF